MADTVDISSRFESLGDNCELGFIQRFAKNEEGGLLRWSVCPAEALIAAIEDNFAQVYQYENLSPHTDGMIVDKKYGLYFHTKMRSKNKIFVHDEDERRALWEAEYGKLCYLVEKMNNLLITANRIFVYKRNGGI